MKPSQMALMTANGKKSALDIALSMCDAYRTLHPGKSLPVLEYKNGSKDRPLLEMLFTRMKEKSTQQLGKETLEEQKNITLLSQIKDELVRQEKEITNPRENTQDI